MSLLTVQSVKYGKSRQGAKRHGGGHWFNPSIAHPYRPRIPGPVAVQGVTRRSSTEASGRIGATRELRRKASRLPCGAQELQPCSSGGSMVFVDQTTEDLSAPDRACGWR